MKNFVAFNFDTANSSRHSICAVGLVFVENGKIKESIYQLINPEEEFDRFKTTIHKITPEDIKDAPNFAVFYHSISEKIADKLLVTHNLLIDGYALKDNLLKYKIEPCYNQLLCTYQLAKRIMVNPPSYSLNSLCEYYGIVSNNRHSTLADAEICAKLMLQLVEEARCYDIDSLYHRTRIIPGVIDKGRFSPSLVKSSRSNWVTSSTFISAKNVATENVFQGKNVVFTKKLDHFTRSQAAQLVISQGGRFQSGINSETDYLVVGNLDEVMKRGNKSSKLVKAEKMILEGKNLEILSEEVFMRMAKNNKTLLL